MPTLYLDLETASMEPIRAGVHRYAEQARVLLLAYAVDEGGVGVVDIANGEPLPDELASALADEHTLVWAHNAQFDRTILAHQHPGWCPPLHRWRCTMAQALAHGLPGGLEQLCTVMGLAGSVAKSREGKALIQRFCAPDKRGAFATRATHPEEWARFIAYAAQDIVAMRTLRSKMPGWNYPKSMQEVTLWQLDQTVNSRGVAVDLDLARAAIRLTTTEKARLAAEAKQLSAGYISASTQRDALLTHLLLEHGVPLPDLTSGTLDKVLERADLPEPVRDLLRNRQQASMTSTSKYQTLVASTNTDGRLRGTLQYCGASRTGRWAGRIFQPQNLPRPKAKADQVDASIAAIKDGSAPLIYSNLMQTCSDALRGALIAPPGKKLVVADLSNIEGRVLAWLAGEEWKLQAYRDFDAGHGADLYKLAYARAFNVAPEAVTPEQRQLGKVMELACGYQGSVGAYGSMAALYGLDLPEDTIRALVKAWRAANPSIVTLWYDLERVFKTALEDDGVTKYCGKLRLRRNNRWLAIGLPSGRVLAYPAPRLNSDGQITYMGINQYTRKWERLETYGGKLVENCTQAVARDILAANMHRAEHAGYPIVLSVHDELLTETPDSPSFTAAQLSQIMSTGPGWASGLPLAAAGFETHRYRKG